MKHFPLPPTLKHVALIVLVMTAGTGASAEVSQSTTYNYFKIQGKTAPEIYASLLKYAKGPSGHDAYATTAVQVFQKTKVVGTNPCRIQKVDLNATFKITLPRLHSTGIAPKVGQSWRSFERALLTHEEHHRSLWMACVAKLERQIKTLKAKDCSTLSANFKSIWKSIETECKAQNNRFDASEQVVLLKQPFIRLVVNTRR